MPNKTQKIKVLYRLSDEALRKYFLEGNKQEKYQELWIETNNEHVIEKSKLIDNDHLELELYEKKYIKVKLQYYYDDLSGENRRIEKYSKEELNKKIKELHTVYHLEKFDTGFLSYFFDSLITLENVINFVMQEIADEKEVAITVEEFNQTQGKETFEKINEELMRKEKEQELLTFRRKEAEKQMEIEIDKFIDEHGSETVKLRKELGYYYKDLVIQEKTDVIEKQIVLVLDNIFKINWNTEIYSDEEKIKKPRLEILKLIKKLKKNPYIEDVYAEIWREKIFSSYEPEEKKIEIIAIVYNVFDYTVTRYYRI